MLKNRSRLLFGLALLAALESPAGPSPEPSVSPEAYASASPSPFASDLPAGLAGPGALTPAEGKKLVSEFKKAQSTELKALAHRHKAELGELKVAQKARRAEWEQVEREKLRKNLAAAQKGPEKRAFVQDYHARFAALRKIIKDEYSQRDQEQRARYDAVKADQALKLKEFQDAVAAGRRPPAELWPSGGR